MSSSGVNFAIVGAIRDVRYHSGTFEGIVFLVSCLMLIILRVACLTYLVWHCLLTFDDDVHYIWTYVYGINWSSSRPAS